MSTHVVMDDAADAARPDVHPASAPVALLGCGQVGAALTRLLTHGHPGRRMHITRALVRSVHRPQPLETPPPFTVDPALVFAPRPQVVVELLGGCEPARRLVLEALDRRVPVVTANKSLLARHGQELRGSARANGTPLLYEAAVLAGVPFLGTFARRPFAACATGFAGILNGTSNFVLTRCGTGAISLADALAEATRAGYAEPDPHNDIAGIDAAEKLVVLLQQFAGLDVAVEDLELAGIDDRMPASAQDAAELGGVIKPVVQADWSSGLQAVAGPAYVPAGHPLHDVNGAENAVILETSRGRLLFQGPGAGPAATAATVLDDVNEVLAGTCSAAGAALRGSRPEAPETGWLVSLSGPRLPKSVDVADHLASHGVFVRRSGDQRWHEGRQRQAFLTWPVEREQLDPALVLLAKAAGCACTSLRALERVP